jgi:hypothetical protein
MMRSITHGLDPFRPTPGELVQTLPGKRANTTLLGHLIAAVAGVVLAVLALAFEGALS